MALGDRGDSRSSFSVVRQGPYYYLKDRSVRNGVRRNTVLECFGRTRPTFHRPRLYFGSALETLSGLDTASIDLLLTDPPYGVTSADWDHAPDWSSYAKELCRVLKPTGVAVISGTVRSLLDVRDGLGGGLEFRNDFVWVKTTSNGFLHTGAKPSRTLPAPAHENLWVFARRGVAASKLTFNEKALRREAKTWPSPKKRSGRRVTSTWGQGSTTASSSKRLAKRPCKCAADVLFEEYVHDGALAVAKPLDLMRLLVLAYSNPGETVLDPFAGSGTTLIAAFRTGRKSIGFEKDEHNFRGAVARLEGMGLPRGRGAVTSAAGEFGSRPAGGVEGVVGG